MLSIRGSSNECSQHVLWRNTDTYAYKLIYHQMPSLPASLNHRQKTVKIGSIYLFIYLFIYYNTHSKLSISYIFRNVKKESFMAYTMTATIFEGAIELLRSVLIYFRK